MVYDVQKASMWKRLSAYLFDIILLVIAAVGVAFLLSSALNYEAHLNEREKIRVGYETQYGVDFDISKEDYDKLSDDGKKAIDDAYALFVTDPEVNKIDLVLANLVLIIVTFAALIPYLLLEFFIPLLFRNGQTIGKKVFGVGVMRVDGVKISPLQLFIRTILGKCTIETLLPVFLALMLMFNYMPMVGMIGFLAIAIIQFFCIVATRYHTPMHELLSATVSVDLSSQLIFDTPEALMEYKKALHAKEAEKSAYI